MRAQHCHFALQETIARKEQKNAAMAALRDMLPQRVKQEDDMWPSPHIYARRNRRRHDVEVVSATPRGSFYVYWG